MKKYILLKTSEVLEIDNPDQLNEFGYTNLDYVLNSPNYSGIDRMVLDTPPPPNSTIENGVIVQKQEVQRNIPLEIAQKRLTFWSQMFTEFLAENITLQLSKPQVRALDAKLENVFKYLSKTGFETGLEELQAISTDAVFSDLRKQNFIQKIQKYLQDEANYYYFS